uniref:Toxin-like protein 10 n=1 Tax=Urodacus yaschenkoi TaxID=1273102 RepID=TXUA_UROYA|nr:RecName: Full=Toxin-like protein 10; Flags: Precursor [Urodacus yaschenkoi]AGA82763.1 toxin-like protein 10 precursor [Urodacus yaschenkoi]
MKATALLIAVFILFSVFGDMGYCEFCDTPHCTRVCYDHCVRLNKHYKTCCMTNINDRIRMECLCEDKTGIKPYYPNNI